ncbi:ExbD/TolR family protein [Methylogaea oryzae]|uniref:Biopolymer transporter ExbD n=1 Tax=Methylogaea oryzae TaxID=1295382 RepID=A0A8D4VPW3_9GAMM|nr:biopolymer transporter ExbD [Methylogaea oryzae]BBL70482.1 biopolymer transporter ExbD [Methylogaea oryzae]
MNFRRRSRGRDNLELNVTSMIDVLLILLIFFILTTTFSRETQLHVSLPEAAGEQPESDNKPLEIAIDAEGRYAVDQHQVINTQLDTLKRALEDAAGDNKEKTVVISADGKTPHQAVITALDAASQLGLTRITFAAQGPQ